MIDLDDLNTAHRVVIEPQLLRIIRIDYHGLTLGIGVDGVPLDALYLSYDQCAGDREDDLALGIGPVQAVGGQMAILVCKVGAIRIGDLELDTFQRRLICTGQLVNNQITLGLVTELQSDRLAGLDLGRLGCVVQQEPFFCPGFTDHQRGAGVNIFNQDGARRVGGKIAVTVAHHGAVALGHKELDIRNGRVIDAGHLLDEQRPLW